MTRWSLFIWPHVGTHRLKLNDENFLEYFQLNWFALIFFLFWLNYESLRKYVRMFALNGINVQFIHDTQTQK